MYERFLLKAQPKLLQPENDAFKLLCYGCGLFETVVSNETKKKGQQATHKKKRQQKSEATQK